MPWNKTDASGMRDVAVAPDGTVWLAGWNGTIWFSHDQGKTFQQQADASGFSRVAVAPDGTVWGVGYNGTLWNFTP
jgi:photosystem II stability/assembly factor-like uncharacterized protein